MLCTYPCASTLLLNTHELLACWLACSPKFRHILMGFFCFWVGELFSTSVKHTCSERTTRAMSSSSDDHTHTYSLLVVHHVLQILSTALVKAERENATVYLQRVPNFADLPPIQPYILVKSLSLPDIDAAGETLFQTVIPDNRYSFNQHLRIKLHSRLSTWSLGPPVVTTALVLSLGLQAFKSK